MPFAVGAVTVVLALAVFSMMSGTIDEADDAMAALGADAEPVPAEPVDAVSSAGPLVEVAAGRSTSL